jgi:hypothetical protein
MVEVANDPTVPPPPRTREELQVRHKMTRRQALLTSGIVIGSVGVVLTGIGAGFFAGGQENERQEIAECNADTNPNNWHLLCGFGGRLESAIGSIVLGVGVPTLVTGVGLTLGGAAQPK